MPVVASTIRTGYSNRSKFSRRMKVTDMAIAAADPVSASTFISRANGSTTNAPLKAVPSPVNQTSQSPAMISTASARPVTDELALRPRNTPSINRNMAPIASTSSGAISARSGVIEENSNALFMIRSLIRYGRGHLACSFKGGVVVLQQCVDRRRCHIEDRRWIHTEENHQHHQREQDFTLAT